MNTAQKVIIFLAVTGLLFFLSSVEIGQEAKVLVVKYGETLVDYEVKPSDDLTRIRLKSKQDILFFDGQYFYDEVPKHKEGTKVSIVQEKDVIKGGDFTAKQVIILIFGVLLITFITYSVASDESDYDGY